jgi:DMSO/TMAO reductase YedYZ molybdopterin-dependent catalytic subunit
MTYQDPPRRPEPPRYRSLAKYQNSAGYQDSPGYQEADGYQDTYREGQGPQSSAYQEAFPDRQNHQDPYQGAPGYQNGNGYRNGNGGNGYGDRFDGGPGTRDPYQGAPNMDPYRGAQDFQAPYPGQGYQEQGYQDARYAPTTDWQAPELEQLEDPNGPRGPRGMRTRIGGLFPGAIIGALAAALAIAVAILAAAFVRPQASPIIAIGGKFIDLTPAWLKEFAIKQFGSNDKNMLLLGMYVTIAIIAMVLGVFARKNVKIGLIGIGLFGLFGAYIAITRPAARTSDGVPSIIGGIAGAVALYYLVEAATPKMLAAAGRRTRGAYNRTVGARMDRRRFLLTGAVTATAAAVGGIGGQIYSNKKFLVNTNSVKIAAPAKAAPKLAKGTIVKDIPGLSSFYTPDNNFYRVDTAIVVPQVQAATWELKIHGMVDNPMTMNFTELQKLPSIDRDITLCCVSQTVGGNYIGNARWTGTLLADVLRKVGIQKGADQVVMRDVNQMNIGVSLAAIMDGRDALLAYGMNGTALPAEHGFPVRVVVPGLYGYVSACKWVVDMELTTYAAFDSYWQVRGWAARAPIKTESRIDTPKTGAALKAGKNVIAGVAWAQHKGIEKVEVSVDGGATWNVATLAAQDTIDTWRQFYYIWDATTAGGHTIKARATDKTGYTQTAMVHRSEYNGATGYHTINVTVA